MSLKIKSWRRILKWATWSLLGFLFLVFLLRVASFEHTYYASKEGSERAVVVTAPSEEENLIEEEPTEDDLDAYLVEENKPRFLTIEKLDIVRARILPMGINAGGDLATPNNIYDVGWYEASGLPGYGGTMIIDGHSGGPHVSGVFKNLPNLTLGDIIEVERGDEAIFRYIVKESNTVALVDADAYMATAAKSPERGRESITLISCTGEWSDRQQTYLARQFVRAVLIEDTENIDGTEETAEPEQTPTAETD